MCFQFYDTDCSNAIFVKLHVRDNFGIRKYYLKNVGVSSTLTLVLLARRKNGRDIRGFNHFFFLFAADLFWSKNLAKI